MKKKAIGITLMGLFLAVMAWTTPAIAKGEGSYFLYFDNDAILRINADENALTQAEAYELKAILEEKGADDILLKLEKKYNRHIMPFALSLIIVRQPNQIHLKIIDGQTIYIGIGTSNVPLFRLIQAAERLAQNLKQTQ